MFCNLQQLWTWKTLKVSHTRFIFLSWLFIIFLYLPCSPYAYQFGLGKRADGEDISNYDDEVYDKPNLNMENWVDGGSFDNKDDIDVYDYGLPRGGLEIIWFWDLIKWRKLFQNIREQDSTHSVLESENIQMSLTNVFLTGKMTIQYNFVD